MTFTIGVGKIYATRDGRVSSKTYMEKHDSAIYAEVEGKAYRYWPSGRTDLVKEAPMDLIKEWRQPVTIVGDAPPVNLQREKEGGQYITANGRVVTLSRDQECWEKGFYFSGHVEGEQFGFDGSGRAFADLGPKRYPNHNLVAKWPSPNYTMMPGPNGSERWVMLEQAQRMILEGSITAQVIKEGSFQFRDASTKEVCNSGWLSIASLGAVKHFTPRKKAERLKWPETPEEIAFWTGATMADSTKPSFLNDLTDASPISDMGKASTTEALITSDKIATPAQSEGRKDDASKVRMDLLPPEFLFATATILTFGATKYGAYNWSKGMAWSRCFSAMMRHMWAWWGGAGPTRKSFLFGDLDDETKFSHLWHAAATISFLIAYEERKLGTDDRERG